MTRRVFTTKELRSTGLTTAAIKWQVRTGALQPVARGAFIEGPEPPTPLELAVGAVVAAGGIASGSLAGVLYGLDAVTLKGADCTVDPNRGAHRSGSRRRVLQNGIDFAEGVATVSALHALLDLAAELDDLEWEQALESALRKRLVTVEEIEKALPEMGRARIPGVRRIRRVLSLRPSNAPPTESLLETLMIQLIRGTSAPEPHRQFVVLGPGERAIARLDLAWPELGVFVELDGQHHQNQPEYDSARETAVVAATGWLCARFTWREVTGDPVATGRRLEAILNQARRRPLK